MGSDTLRDECRLSVRLPADEHDYLRRMAGREDTTVSALVRRAVTILVADAIKAYGPSFDFPPAPDVTTSDDGHGQRDDPRDVSSLLNVLSDALVSIGDARDDRERAARAELSLRAMEDWVGFELADGWRFLPAVPLSQVEDDDEEDDQ